MLRVQFANYVTPSGTDLAGWKWLGRNDAGAGNTSPNATVLFYNFSNTLFLLTYFLLFRWRSRLSANAWADVETQLLKFQLHPPLVHHHHPV